MIDMDFITELHRLATNFILVLILLQLTRILGALKEQTDWLKQDDEIENIGNE